MTGVRFIRMRGRVIPILSRATIGTVFGGAIGQVAAQDHKKSKAFGAEIRSNAVESKQAISRSGVKDVIVVSNMHTVKKHFGFFARGAVAPALKMAQRGENAFALQYRKKDFVIVGKHVNPQVIGHELGHIKDFRKRGALGRLDTGVFGALTGKTLAREKAAWRLSTYKQNRSLRKPALESYERNQRGARWGALAGALGGIISAMK